MHRIYYSVCLLLLCSFLSHAQVTSTFDVNADGWTSSGNVTAATFSATGGNPGGRIQASDFEPGFTPFNFWYWNAPAKFLGNKTLSYGLNLTFDLQQSVSGNNNTLALVHITNGSTTLYYFPSTPPAISPAWTSYTVKLDEISTGWKTSNSSTGTAATKLQIKTVLSNLTAVLIRGEYNANNLADTGGLDNVILESLPTVGPIITSFTPTSGNPLTTNVTITGNNFSSTAGSNVVYFGSTQAAIVSENATQLVVTVPRGAAYGPITVINKTTNTTGESHGPFNPTFDGGGRIIPASFSTPTQMLAAASNNILGSTVADLDGDGWTDVLFSESTANSISVFRNLGAGGDISGASFASKVSFAGAGNSYGLKTADLDGDGKLDILAAYESAALGLVHFATFRNTSTPGNLSFESVELWPSIIYSGSMSNAVDVDGDGRIDLIGQHSSSSSTSFWVAQNISTAGNIELGASVSYGGIALSAGTTVNYGDLNNDGKPEMLIAHSFAGNFSVLPNTSSPGSISFGTPIAMTQGLYGRVMIADFNLDGKNDIAWKQGSSNNDVRIRINSNSGGALAATDFSTEVILNTDLIQNGALSIGDYNGDGKVDLFAKDDSSVGVFENVYSGGAFNASAFIPAFLIPGASLATYTDAGTPCDVNGDGKPEFITTITSTSPHRVYIYQNKNYHAPAISLTTVSPLKGPVGSTVTITGDYFSTIASANVVKFGGGVQATVLSATKTSLTVSVPAGASYGPVSVTTNELTSQYHLPFDVIYSPGRTIDASSFSTPVNFLLTAAGSYVQAGDFNGDKKVDIVAVGQSSRSYFFRNTHGSGAISTSSLTVDDTTSTTALSPTLIDLDGDGRIDLASNAGVYRNTTSGIAISFDAGVNISNANNMGVGDFNLDGRMDFCGNSGSVYIYENRTTTGGFQGGTYSSLSSPFFISAGGTASGTAVADFDNDGLPDIAHTVYSSIDYISFYRNVGGGRITNPMFVSGQSFNTLDLPDRIYEADLDVDGKMDVVIYHNVGGVDGTKFSIFHNQSSGPGNINFVKLDFTLPVNAGVTTGPSAIADLDGDGKPEIIITSAGTTKGYHIYKNNTTPGVINTTSSFTTSGFIPLAGVSAVVAADINSDSKPDLVFTRTANQLSILENLIPGVAISFTTQPAPATVCSGNNTTFSVNTTGDTGLIYQWQAFDGNGYSNISNNATYSGTTTNSLAITNATSAINGASFRVIVRGDLASPTASATAALTVVAGVSAPGVSSPTICSGSTAILNATGGSNGQYKWYTTAAGNTEISGEVNASYTSPALANTTSYFVSRLSGGCESPRAQGIVTVNNLPAAPTVSGTNSRCGTGAVTLTVTGGTNGNYRWYDVASGGTAITGEVNSAYATPSLTATTTFYSVLSNGTCESTRTPVIATVNTPPAKPTIGSTVTPVSGTVTVCNTDVTLSAPAGFTYLWSNGATTQQVTTNVSGTFSVIVTDGNSCASPSSDVITIVSDAFACNQPPAITPQQVVTNIQGKVSLTLSDIISDPDNNADLTTATITSQPKSGASAQIVNGILQLDYSGIFFSGKDVLTIRVCDLAGSCTTENITIDVVGDIKVYNAVSANGDNLNAILRLEYIDIIPGAEKNKVTIFNRWGDKVFEITGYNNSTKVFEGLNNDGVELPSGTYFYRIEFTGANALPSRSGYLSLKR